MLLVPVEIIAVLQSFAPGFRARIWIWAQVLLVGAAILAVLDSHPSANLVIWTVAAALEQALSFRGLPWVITPRQRGAMVRKGDKFELQDSESGDLWSVSIEALES